jgi:hypothetical protein
MIHLTWVHPYPSTDRREDSTKYGKSYWFTKKWEVGVVFFGYERTTGLPNPPTW